MAIYGCKDNYLLGFLAAERQRSILYYADGLSIQFQPLHPISDRFEVLSELLLTDHYRATAIVGVETERSGVLQVLVEKQDYVMFGIIDQPEGTDAAGFQPEITHHPLGACEREFAGSGVSCGLQRGFEPLLQVVNSQVVVAIETDQIVLIALVVAHKDVFAMHTPVVVPPAFRLLDGLALGVVVARIIDVMRLQIPLYLFLPIHKIYP